MSDIFAEIKSSKQKKQFKKYIDYIRYPKYKNLVRDTKIAFDFPLTVFVGKNGSGKSSVLKSVYGCVEGKNIGDYWFSTKIDPIVEGKGERNCFIYNYEDKKDPMFEVLIQRAVRKDNPDYWETAKPVSKYKMKLNTSNKAFRKKKLQTDVHYIDFHSVLSAFDKFRYFLNSEKKTENNSYLRFKSKLLLNVLNNNSIIQLGNPKKAQNEVPITLSRYEINEISKILGKQYVNTKIIKHKFFKLWGQSTIFSNSQIEYSEAFAGSGENAVVTLVKEIVGAKNNSIILLDEPETCLHPGAQKNIFRFLLEQCNRKKLQIVISTHSKEFLKGLPNNAIKVFNELPTGEIEILNECNSKDAFFYIGEDIEDKKTIIVEDRLAKEILISVAKNIGEACINQLNIQYASGGSKEIKKSIAWYSKLKEKNKFIVFDGDELKNNLGASIKICDPATISYGKVNANYLEDIIKEQTQISSTNYFGFNSNETDDNKKKAYMNYLTFFKDKVHFLPLSTPEEIIWDDQFMESHSILTSANKKEIKRTSDFKIKFRLFSSFIFLNEDSESIFSSQRMFITNWIKKSNMYYFLIKDIINLITNDK